MNDVYNTQSHMSESDRDRVGTYFRQAGIYMAVSQHFYKPYHYCLLAKLAKANWIWLNSLFYLCFGHQ